MVSKILNSRSKLHFYHFSIIFLLGGGLFWLGKMIAIQPEGTPPSSIDTLYISIEDTSNIYTDSRISVNPNKDLKRDLPQDIYGQLEIGYLNQAESDPEEYEDYDEYEMNYLDN